MNDDDDTRDLRARIDDRVRAVRAKDIDALLSSYAPDVVTCDLVAPLVNHGVAAVRARVADWFGSFATAIDYEIRDVVLAVAGDVAFDHHMWFRETVGYRKRDGRWLVVHQHSSVPFDMTSGKPRLDLEP